MILRCAQNPATRSLMNIVGYYESISPKCAACLASKGFELNVIYLRGEIREIFIERRPASFDLDEPWYSRTACRYVIM